MPHGDAAELAQDSLADAHLSMQTCRGDVADPQVFGRWLRGIARNKFRNWSRSRYRRERLATTTEPGTLDHVAMDSVEATAEADRLEEHLARLRAEIQRLPTKNREVVMMHYLDETPVADVAALLSLSVKTVEGRLYQARRILRRRMNDATTWNELTKAVML
jgi:RNA polymerase sigma-70 factor (ECF subfamily)